MPVCFACKATCACATQRGSLCGARPPRRGGLSPPLTTHAHIASSFPATHMNVHPLSFTVFTPALRASKRSTVNHPVLYSLSAHPHLLLLRSCRYLPSYHRFVTWNWFDRVVLGLILLNTLCMALTDYSVVDPSTLEPVPYVRRSSCGLKNKHYTSPPYCDWILCLLYSV